MIYNFIFDLAERKYHHIQILSLFKFGFGLPALLLLFMLLKNDELLLYFIDVAACLVLLIFLRAYAYILVIPPY